jgi:thiamine-monophosphate kinase
VLFSEAVDAEGAPDAARAVALRDRTVAQFAPTPPIGDGRLAALAGATAMIDLSDGLAIDAGRVAAASGVAIDFESAALGADTALALGGGEDHSLLATFPPGAELAGAELPGGFRRIGSVVAGSGIRLDGVEHPVMGWDPFTGWDRAGG